jgi:ferredoxin
MRALAVDWTRCDGHGLCHALLPEAIDLDEWGFPIIRDASVPAELLPHARRAAASCPALALRVERVPERRPA